MNIAPQPTATAAYLAARDEGFALLDILRSDLRADDEALDRDPHWGHVGSLGHLRARLIELALHMRSERSAEALKDEIARRLPTIRRFTTRGFRPA